ncbi:MAG: AzlC family ABC transporter permease [Oscillospiraceae bacterium]|nr:AzlC family ABC transporter permease [Oscillospiraceae bacterium]
MAESKNTKKIGLKAFRATLPVMAGYIVLGIGFGVLLQTKGYGVLWAAAMSLFIYAGSMQYVAIDLITGGVSLLTAAVVTFVVNARHLFYGISVVDRYRGAGRKKPYMIFALTDETYSLICGDDGFESERERHSYDFLVSLFDHIYWLCGGVMGSLLGKVLPFDAEGIDFALTALFVTVFVDQWTSTNKHAPAVCGVTASVVCLLIFGSENFLIPSMVLIVAALTLMRGKAGVSDG